MSAFIVLAQAVRCVVCGLARREIHLQYWYAAPARGGDGGNFRHGIVVDTLFPEQQQVAHRGIADRTRFRIHIVGQFQGAVGCRVVVIGNTHGVAHVSEHPELECIRAQQVAGRYVAGGVDKANSRYGNACRNPATGVGDPFTEIAGNGFAVELDLSHFLLTLENVQRVHEHRVNAHHDDGPHGDGHQEFG